VLIIHSEDDLRCPISQAEELFVALRWLGREPELVRFPDETHELSRSGSPRHRIMRAELILDWFRQHLGDEAGAGPAASYFDLKNPSGLRSGPIRRRGSLGSLDC